MTTRWTSYAQALADTDQSTRHLLLGNGFSVGAHPRFSYTSLYAEAVRADPSIGPLFDGHGSNFEEAIQATEDPQDQLRIRNALVTAIAEVHPKIRYLDPTARAACGQFLERFAGLNRGNLRGRVFTTNYDMFVYWVLMQHKRELNLQDGFDHDGLWKEGLLDKTWVFYLHGALHLYTRPFGYVRPVTQTLKLMYREGYPIPDQVRDSVRSGVLPLFVSEGESLEKLRTIRRNRYLRKANERFARACTNVNTAVFTIGHSLHEVDRHITDAMGNGAAHVYVGVHRPTDDGALASKTASRWAEMRGIANEALRVRFFDSAECPIWSANIQD